MTDPMHGTTNVPLDRSHLPKIEAHVRETLGKMPLIYRYHTLDHTLAVVSAAKEIAHQEGLSDNECLIIEAAAWFHDVGYLRSLAEHETMSAFRSLLYLTILGIDLDDVDRIEQCILVTKIGSEPKNAEQCVLCDADMWHLTCDDFWMWSDRLRKEWVAMKGLNMTNDEWVRFNITFMRSVVFRTAYGKEVLQPRMEANIKKLEGML